MQSQGRKAAWKLALRALLRDWLTLGAAIFLVLLVVAAVAPDLVAPYSPYDQDLTRGLLPPMSPGPGWFPHLMGTDALGRDMFSRLIVGGRISLVVGLSSVFLSASVGVLIGLTAGYLRGRVDDLVMRAADLQLAFPSLLIALFVLFSIGQSLTNMLIVMALIRWPLHARLARGMALSLREQEFVEGAIALGCSRTRIIFRHLLPNLVTPVLVLATLELARMILLEATLSFLGLGIQPPLTSWGLEIAVGRTQIRTAWWLVTMPGLVMFLAVLNINIVAMWLRAVTDPTERWRWLTSKKKAVEGVESLAATATTTASGV